MKRLATSGYFLVLISTLGFSFKAVLAKVAFGYGVDAMTLMLMRTYISLPLFIATFFLLDGRRAIKVTFKELILFAFMGIVGIGCAMFFSFYSIELIDASLSTLVVFTYPAMTLILLMLFSRERTTAVKLLSLAVTFFGLIVMLRVDRADFLAVNKTGIVFALLAAFFFAVYNALSERVMKGMEPIKLISYSTFFLVGFFGLSFGSRPYPANFEVWGIAVLLGVFAGYIPFLCFMYGIKRIGAGKAVIISSLGPVLTVTWATLFLGESLDLIQISGMVMVVLGVMFLRLKSPVKLVAGTGDEVKQKLKDIVRLKKNSKRVFALIYLSGKENPAVRNQESE